MSVFKMVSLAVPIFTPSRSMSINSSRQSIWQGFDHLDDFEGDVICAEYSGKLFAHVTM